MDLPDDKIPMIMSTAGYGFAWLPDPWIFNPRPTYGHEAAAFYDWYRKEKGIDGPLKIGIISSEASPKASFAASLVFLTTTRDQPKT